MNPEFYKVKTYQANVRHFSCYEIYQTNLALIGCRRRWRSLGSAKTAFPPSIASLILKWMVDEANIYAAALRYESRYTSTRNRV